MNLSRANVRRFLFVLLAGCLLTPNTAVCLDIQLNYWGEFQQRRDAMAAMETVATIGLLSMAHTRR